MPSALKLTGPAAAVFQLALGTEHLALTVAEHRVLERLKVLPQSPNPQKVRHALENDAYAGHLTLYQGARTREWLYDVEFFRSLAAEFPDQFTYRPCLSEETADDCAGDATAYGFGMVTDVIATGESGRSLLFRGAVAIASTTSRPLVTWPNRV